MLFLPEAVFQERKKLLAPMAECQSPDERACRRLLEVDPADHLALAGLGRARSEAGDLAGAAECFWSAAQAQPWSWIPYLELSQLLLEPEDEPLFFGLGELAMRKLLLDEEGLESMDPEQLPRAFGSPAGLLGLDKAAQVALFADLLRRQRDLERLTERLDQVPKEDRGELALVLMSALIAKRGRAGIELARAMLGRDGPLLPRKSRADCEAMLEAAGEMPPVSVPASPPSPWTVYDICAGEADWKPEESQEDQGGDFRPAAPARRPAAPGRNEPCWCGSGKKYKKCHLDSDQPRAPDAPAAPGGLGGPHRRHAASAR